MEEATLLLNRGFSVKEVTARLNCPRRIVTELNRTLWTKRLLAREVAEERWSKEEPNESRALWPAGGPVRNVRDLIRAAAFALDRVGEFELADWLLTAKPAHIREVATGIAAIGLREGVTDAWDMLVPTNIADYEKASEMFDHEKPINWQPEAAWLIP